MVNSEIIQRLGTDYPHAGGEIDADKNPVLDQNDNPVRDLQMTTIDPHDFSQESLKLSTPIPNVNFVDYRDFNEPEVVVWDNVTFADNYYQTVANPNGNTFTPNGREIPSADLNVQLNGKPGFVFDNGIGGNHTRMFSWYAGMADFNNQEFFTSFVPNTSPTPDQPLVNTVLDILGDTFKTIIDTSVGVLDQIIETTAAVIQRNPFT